MDTTSSNTMSTALSAGAIGFGVLGVLTPGALGRIYGMGEASPGQLLMTRMWGTRNVVLGALLLMAPERRSTLAGLSAGLNAADSLITALAPGIPARMRFAGSLTSAGFAAVAATIATSGD